MTDNAGTMCDGRALVVCVCVARCLGGLSPNPSLSIFIHANDVVRRCRFAPQRVHSAI